MTDGEPADYIPVTAGIDPGDPRRRVDRQHLPRHFSLARSAAADVTLIRKMAPAQIWWQLLPIRDWDTPGPLNCLLAKVLLTAAYSRG